LLAKQYTDYLSAAYKVVDKLKQYNKIKLAAALQEEIDYLITLRYDSEWESVLCGNDLEYYIEMVNEAERDARRDAVVAEIFRVQEELRRRKSRRAEEMTWLFMRHGPMNLCDDQAIDEHEWYLMSFQEELEFLDEQDEKELGPIAVGFGALAVIAETDDETTNNQQEEEAAMH
jgi:hypothetical protein